MHHNFRGLDMINGMLKTRRNHERNKQINNDVCAQIKYLQRELVSLSFSSANVSEKFLLILKEINDLRSL
jgi:hypothetical protein